MQKARPQQAAHHQNGRSPQKKAKETEKPAAGIFKKF